MSVTLQPGAGFDAVGQILWFGRQLGPGAWGPSSTQEPDVDSPLTFAAELAELFHLLTDRKVPYLLVGGVALLRYVEGRNTQDIDLLLSVAALPRLPEIILGDQNIDFARGHYKSVRVDLLLSENPVFRLALDQYATQHRFDDIDVPCATPEGLILLKFYALPALYRSGNFQRAILYENDIAMLLQRYRPDVAPLLAAVQPFVAPPEHVELVKIVTEIQARIARMTPPASGSN